MNLLSVRIKNFRSIKDEQIEFSKGCHVLVGINESGKSNILRALQLLDTSVTPNPSDLRIESKDEDVIVEGFVQFRFQLDDSECTEIFDLVSKQFASTCLDEPLFKWSAGVVNLEGFVKLRSEILYQIDIPSGKRFGNYWALGNSHGYEILPFWKRIHSAQTFQIGGASVSVLEKGFAIVPDGATLVGSVENVTPQMVNSLIGLHLIKFADKSLPKCVFWKYSDSFLLPSTVDITQFSARPDFCMPLKSMFELAGYKAADIPNLLSPAARQPYHRYRSMLNRVAEASTSHLRRIWKDHKTIKIELNPDGNILAPMISDHQLSLDMASRSDGFKRLVSFLLMVSAKVQTAEMKDVLLLVDEPEIALHPGGARSLMRELVEIGKSNKVVYSTHSIFMIDQEVIERHLIVEKLNEVTVARVAERAKIQDEEVLYAAMGYSMFEVLKRKNIIFEGWRDKAIFRIVRDAMVKSKKLDKVEVSKYGETFAEGVKDVKHVARFLELAGRGCLVISDADMAAFVKKKEYEKPGAWGTWATLHDVFGTGGPTTGEDLFQRAALIKRANKFRTSIDGLGVLSESAFNSSQPSMSVLKAWVSTAGAKGEALDNQINELKESLYSDLKRDELLETADKLVEFVMNHDYVELYD